MLFTIVVVSLALALLAIALPLAFWPLSIWSIHRYARSLVGLDLQAARRILQKDQVVDEPWEKGQFGGQSLVAKYRRYTLRLMFDESEKVIFVSIAIMTRALAPPNKSLERTRDG
jgi:hypothetical protein